MFSCFITFHFLVVLSRCRCYPVLQMRKRGLREVLPAGTGGTTAGGFCTSRSEAHRELLRGPNRAAGWRRWRTCTGSITSGLRAPWSSGDGAGIPLLTWDFCFPQISAFVRSEHWNTWSLEVADLEVQPGFGLRSTSPPPSAPTQEPKSPAFLEESSRNRNDAYRVSQGNKYLHSPS